MTDLHTSRSQILDYEHCPRLRLLAHHTGPQGLGSVGIGWSPKVPYVPLAKGSAIHLGLQRLLEGSSVDEAVQDALSLYDETVKLRGFGGVRDQDQEYTFCEQRALCEAAIRVWAKRRLPWYLANYEIVALEREAPVMDLAPGVKFHSRPDGVLRSKSSGLIDVLSFKTASAWRPQQDAENQNDVQGLSEAWTASVVHGPVAGVLMEYLILGQRKRQDERVQTDDEAGTQQDDTQTLFRGPKLQQSFLVRPWLVDRRKGTFAWCQEFKDAQGSKQRLAKYFDPSYGLKGKARTESLATHGEWSVERVSIWEHMPVREWIERLDNRQVFPYILDPLAQVSVVRRYDRQAYELEAWRAEAAYGESRVREGVEMLGKAAQGFGHFRTEEILANYFPRRRHECNNRYGEQCQFYGQCWRGDRVEESGVFEARTPNHPEGEE